MQDGQISANDFSYSFQYMYNGITEKLRHMERNQVEELKNFLEPDRTELGNLLADLYGACDSYSPDPSFSLVDQKELEDYAKRLILKLKEK